MNWLEDTTVQSEEDTFVHSSEDTGLAILGGPFQDTGRGLAGPFHKETALALK